MQGNSNRTRNTTGAAEAPITHSFLFYVTFSLIYFLLISCNVQVSNDLEI